MRTKKVESRPLIIENMVLPHPLKNPFMQKTKDTIRKSAPMIIAGVVSFDARP